MFFPVITDTVTKKDLHDMSLQAVEDMLENGNILQAVDLIAKIEYFIKEVKDNPKYVDYVREEIAKYGKATSLPTGTKLELAELGGRYNYSNTNDPVINDLLEKQNDIKIKIKQREDFLKSLPAEGMEIRFNDELIMVYPPFKISTSSFKVTLPK